MMFNKKYTKPVVALALIFFVFSLSAQVVSAGDLDVALDKTKSKAISTSVNYIKKLDKYKTKIANYTNIISRPVSFLMNGTTDFNITLPDTQAIYQNNIDTAKTAINLWNANIQATAELNIAQAEFNQMASVIKIDQVVLPALKTSVNNEKLFGLINELETYNNTLMAVRRDFSWYFNPTNTPEDLQDSIDIVDEVVNYFQTKIQDITTDANQLLVGNTYTTVFNTSDNSVTTKINALTSNIYSSYQNIRRVKSFYNKAYRGVKNIYKQAAQNGLNPTSLSELTPTSSYVDEYNNYADQYSKYNQQAARVCYSAQGTADNRLHKLINYQIKLTDLTNIPLTLVTELETKRTTAISSIEATKGLITDCQNTNFNDAKSAYNNVKLTLSHFENRYKAAYSLNKTQVRVDSINTFIAGFSGAFTTLRGLRYTSSGITDDVFSTEEKTELDDMQTTVGTAITLLAEFDTCKNTLETVIVDPNKTQREINTQLSLCNKKYSQAKKIAYPVQKRWYKLIVQAAEGGALIPTTTAGDLLKDDLKAAKSFASFELKRERYYNSANNIIDKRVRTVNKYKDQISELATSMSSTIGTTLEATTNTFNSKTGEIIDAAGTLENLRTTILATTDYSDLKTVVRSIKDIKINKVLLPAQKILIRLYYQQYKYEVLDEIADVLDTAISSVEFAGNLQQSNLAARINTINDSLSALDSNLGGVQNNLDEIINDISSEEELIKVTRGLQYSHNADISSIKVQLRKLHRDYLNALK